MAHFVFSPSNMDTYRTCPRKFQAQSLTKELKWKATGQKSRGSQVHTAVQRAIKQGLQTVQDRWPSDMDLMYTQQMIEDTRYQMSEGVCVETEHELVINNNMQRAKWWDDDAYLRARADVIIIPDDHLPIEVVDIKTGRRWDDEDFQLRVEALLAHLVYRRPIINYAYWYVDSGETYDGSIDFRNGLSPVQDIITTMRDMKLAMRDNAFFPKDNKFCKWCGLVGTSACGL